MRNTIFVPYNLLEKDATHPTIKHPDDAGMDFYAYGDYIIKPQTFKIIRTGITVELPENFHGLLKPKSGSAFLVGAGVIDNGYQGEILFRLFNVLDYDLVFRDGDPIGQMILLPAYSPTPVISWAMIHDSETDRGNSGGILKELVKE